MTDFWTDLAAPAQATATPEPAPRRARTAKPPPAELIPFADCWLLLRVNDDGEAEDVRPVRGSHFGRLKGEAKDWDRDLHIRAFGDDPQTAWREFVLRWPIVKEQRGDAMRAMAAQVEGFAWLEGQADHWDYAIGRERAA